MIEEKQISAPLEFANRDERDCTDGLRVLELAERKKIDSLYLSAPAIAQIFGLEPMALRRRLERWAEREDVSVLRDEDPRCRKPRIFYDVCKASHVIKQMIQDKREGKDVENAKESESN